MLSSKKKSLKKVLKVIIIITFISILLMFSLTKVIYDKTFERYDKSVAVADGLSYLVDSRKQYTVKTDDADLNGYLYGGNNGALIVVSPGYHAVADNYLWQIKSFNDSGYVVFSFDAMGTGKSGGDSSVGFSREILDLKSVIEYIEKNDRFGYNKLMLFGHSRGGYAVCSILNDYDIDAAVSVSGVNSCMEAVVEPVAQKIGFAAYGNYPMLWLYQTMLFGNYIVDKKAFEEIEKSKAKVLIVQGESDVSYSDRYSIYSYKDVISSDNASFYLCTQKGHSGHTDLLFDDDGTANKSLMAVIVKFLEKS